MLSLSLVSEILIICIASAVGKEGGGVILCSPGREEKGRRKNVFWERRGSELKPKYSQRTIAPRQRATADLDYSVQSCSYL